MALLPKTRRGDAFTPPPRRLWPSRLGEAVTGRAVCGAPPPIRHQGRFVSRVRLCGPSSSRRRGANGKAGGWSVSGTMAARAADENRRPVAQKPTGVRCGHREPQHAHGHQVPHRGCLVPLRRRQEAYAAEELKGRKEDSVAK